MQLKIYRNTIKRKYATPNTSVEIKKGNLSIDVEFLKKFHP